MMIVMKFGGSSVADREQIDKVRGIVASRLERSPIVVSSAHKGMTNLLQEAANNAANGEPDVDPIVEKQEAIAQSMGCPEGLLQDFYVELGDILRGIGLLKELTQRSLDYILSFGERMSVRVIADYFSRNGLEAQAFDAWELGFITDSNFGAARPLLGYERKMQQRIASQIPEGVVPVVTGFVGKNEQDEITTVGRNGSDLSATLIGAAIGAEEVQIWTDTDGVMTADPRFVGGARNIPEMTFGEASELAYFGSRVLHPATLVPAIRKRIPVRVLNTNRPDHAGTVICESVESAGDEVTSIAHKSGQVVLNIISERMFAQSGFLAHVFEVLGRHEVVIDMIATSEVSVSMTTDRLENLNAAIAELEEFGRVTVHTEKAILCVVGRNLGTSHGVGAKILDSLAENKVNIEMLSHGLDSINLSMLIAEADIETAVPLLHRVLFEG